MEFYTIDGVRIAVSLYGDKGVPLLVLHGWGSSSEGWQDVAQLLSQQGYRVIVPDLPGFGLSPEPPRDWSLTEYVALVRNLVVSLDIPRAVLVGHSFGGRVAIEYASLYQDSLDVLILCGAAGIQRHRKKRVRIFFIISKAGNRIFSIPFLSRFREYCRKGLYALIGVKDYYTASETMRVVMSRVIEKPLQHYLRQITIPVLLLWGDKDSATPLKDARLADTLLANSTLIVCKDKGHSLQRECPALLAEHITTFLHKKPLSL
ncbi:MAG: alpha/beta hydrolase [Candidatus Spechtbacteria bacterium SB0662_bin_43]|uniref:Alpha/beta hydrolase n=1 Tax=Candidatus Spechtbacteria bacterium SB0662_bin_43 TaxID=2604897 RepID=A0A845D9C4_9BACT|nr:alpha/beta hydrolase [Candidatus Spechtbacteria bacterium SB0662_bin_43]